MRKNLVIVLLIFLVPLGFYFWLTRDKVVTPSSIASSGDEIIKFSSPMCYECQELEKVFDKVFPSYNEKINLKKIDVTKRDSNVQALIKQYEVNLVPTTVFKNQDGRVLRRIEGCVKPEVLESYLVELTNE